MAAAKVLSVLEASQKCYFIGHKIQHCTGSTFIPGFSPDLVYLIVPVLEESPYSRTTVCTMLSREKGDNFGFRISLGSHEHGTPFGLPPSVIPCIQQAL